MIPFRLFFRPFKPDWGVDAEREFYDGELRSIDKLSDFLFGTASFGLDDITWNDLSMDRVYGRIAGTRTLPGDAALYHMLRHPAREAQALAEREEFFTWVKAHIKERDRLLAALRRPGNPRRIGPIPALNAPAPGRWLLLCASMSVLLLVLIVVAATGLRAVFPFAVLSILANNIVSFILKGRHDYAAESMGNLLALIRCAREMDAKAGGGALIFQKLNALIPAVSKVKDNGLFSILYDNNPLTVIMNFSFLLTPIAYFSIARRVWKLRDVIIETLGILGEIDALLAAASFRDGLPFWCAPVWRERGGVTARGLIHPLVSNGVCNDLDARRHVLLTGSNATGKSTFLKAIAVNAVLAQSILTCAAQSYEAPLFRIQTSMALRDDLFAGESYFIVEIRALKRMCDDARRDDLPGLLIIDEVLRGTNTAERIAASCELLRHFSGLNCLCVAATHDIELTYDLEDCYDNFHFTENISENGMTFDYRLHKGRTTSRNAIALLRHMGFDQDLVNRAAERAKNFN